MATSHHSASRSRVGAAVPDVQPSSRATTMVEQRTYAHLTKHQGSPEPVVPFVPFRPCEDKDLLLALDMGLTVAQIALDLGRSQHDIIRRLNTMRTEREAASRRAVPVSRTDDLLQAGVSVPAPTPVCEAVAGGDAPC